MKPLSQETCERMRRLCQVHTQETVAALCGVSKHAVQQAKKRGWKAGKGGPSRRPMPGDYPIQRDHLTVHQLRVHYHTGLGCISRWERELKQPRRYVPRSSSRGALPTPPNLAEVIQQLGATRAAAHFNVHPNTLARMRRDAGLPVRTRSPNRTITKESACV